MPTGYQAAGPVKKHLSLIKRQGLMIDWHSRLIGAGAEWNTEVDIHLNSAQITLLPISPDVLASNYCSGVEM
ncbi:MAG TPA: hypothetical protein VGF67_06395 [Ktedonobacteraceae bacterium]|jgi:hypothetical protein